MKFEQIPLSNCPRPGYPRPDFRRPLWQNLNGEWEFEEDPARSGNDRGLFKADKLKDKIIVPFCRESVLSGLAHLDFCDQVWYRKEVTVPADWRENGRRILFHVGACDYRTQVWVNGTSVGTHIGGMNAFWFDITDALVEGEKQVVTISAIDNVRSGAQCAGKQSTRYESYSCVYTRTTGIWQTVWMESVPASYIRSTRYFPSLSEHKVTIEARIVGGNEKILRAEAFYEGRPVGARATLVKGNYARLEIELDEVHAWEIGNGRLYDLTLTLGEDDEEDVVESYFGLRDLSWNAEGTLYINGKPVFQRLILDQGFYPDGIWTAPTDEELKADIDRSMAMGFHGARLHQKVFEPRFLYECDKAGYIVWGEHGNWGMNIGAQVAYQAMLPDWVEILERDFNHPAIIGWCPLNETANNQIPEFVRLLAATTRAIDPTRPFIDASGWKHLVGVTDIMDSHFYDQDPAALAARLEPLKRGEDIDLYPWANSEKGKPVFISEYGGIRWAQSDFGWGYGNAPADEKEFLDRFRALTETLLFHPNISGLCYTQLTDVEQEVNGLYTYDRKAKFDPALMSAVLKQKAAIEE
jgi:hypothetical protein